MQQEQENWDIIIKPKPGWFELHLDDLWRYKDLLWMFVKRDFISVYKQTILGPLWFVIQPILTTLMFMLVFSNIAKIEVGSMPSMLFYMSGLTVWNYFSNSLSKISSTFLNNANIFGKVYFPRLVVPLSNVISNLISLAIQLGLLLVMVLFYVIFKGYHFHPNQYILLFPLVILLLAGLALGLGIIISSMTTKYRDLSFLVAFGVQLWMYASPVIYPLSRIHGKKYEAIILANPVTPLIELFRLSLFGEGTFSLSLLLYSAGVTVISILGGVIVFNKVEKNFMDTV